MTLEKRIAAFSELGRFLSQFKPKGIEKNDQVLMNDLFFDAFTMLIKRAHESNGWFTNGNVLKAVHSWSILLNKENLNQWTSKYKLTVKNPKTVGVIMAGNIPLVGFHDFISVLISGHKVCIKQSSSEVQILPMLVKYLEYFDAEFKDNISFVKEKLEGFDAVIATGSDNTARYFEYYFGNYPNIIRKNRNSVAVLTGKEKNSDLKALGEDIFRYFGLGCRSVSKIFVPENYDFDLLFNAIYDYKEVMNYDKYVNNYDYNKAVYLMSQYQLLENGFLMLKEDPNYASPIATLFYEYYSDTASLKNKLKTDREKIQCVVNPYFDKDNINFGKTQTPALWDYADGVDTISFLEQL